MEQTIKLPLNDKQVIKTTCAYCGVGCGISAQINTNKTLAAVTGDVEHPANLGRLCSKGSALDETVGMQTRLLQPEIKDEVVSWNEAIDYVGKGLLDIINTYGKDAVAFYGSGQLLTEDYYVANKLMKGFIGSANIDTNSRLCMSSAVAAHKRAFGTDTVPNCYEDIDSAKLLVLIGSNTAWCHPVIFQRIRASKEKNKSLRVVVIDPRRTDTCDIADLHLALAPGSDVVLFNGLLQHLSQSGALDNSFINKHTEGFEGALSIADSGKSLTSIAQACGLDKTDLETFYQWFSETEQTVSLYSQGVNQSSQGTDKANAIINCHLATGRIGKLGCGPFSITGQPNAMGGREVGGLSNQLAAHLELGNAADRALLARFWQTPHVADKPGYAAVDLFDAVYRGDVKAIWIMATNPVVSLPNADKVKAALARCDLVIVSDCIRNTDTLDLATVKLPAAGWGERDGMVTNSERCISHQRAFLTLSGEAKPDWWIITQVARKMGFDAAFPYQHQYEIFKEHASLSGFENNPEQRLRDFDISAFSDISLTDYDHFTPVQWPVNDDNPKGKARFFADGFFYTTNNKARFVETVYRSPVNKTSAEYPLILNTGRIRDQWHTMTRTALSQRLNQHKPEPFIDMHPLDAKMFKLEENDLARITTRWGQMLGRVQLTASQGQGSVFVPMHWNEQFATEGRVGALVNPVVDPISFQPESKHTPATLEKYQAKWHGFILSRDTLCLKEVEYLVKIPCDGFYRYELAQAETFDPAFWKQKLYAALAGKSLSWQEYADPAQGVYRMSCLQAEQLQLVICIAPTNAESLLPRRNWLCNLMARKTLTGAQRIGLLQGKPTDGAEDNGRIICSCFQVGEKTILKAIQQDQLNTAQDVGKKCKAGTNCGSCIPEISKLISMA